MKTDIAYIYALLDPITEEVRYIGKTIDPKKRILEHIYDCKRGSDYKSRWVNSLLDRDLKPLMKLLKVCPLSEYQFYESEYIKIYKSDKLTNSDESGQGSFRRNKEILKRISDKLGRVVYQFGLDGDFIREFESVRYAAKSLNLSHSNISRCCNKKMKHTGGYIFSYQKIKVDKIEKPNAVKKPVIEIDENGKKINEWDSLMSCSRETKIDNGNLSRVCNGKLKHIKNRIFRFG